jgi:hypothetical protein
MINDKDLAEYRTLSTILADLREKLSKKKHELRQLLEETAVYKRNAFIVLARANRLIRHLNGRQRQISGISYYLGELKARINKENLYSPVLVENQSGLEECETLPENCRNLRELKQWNLLIITWINDIKKKILQLELLELRCREIILSVNKALEAFHHESRIIRKKLYPLGVFSILHRFFRAIMGNNYFTFRDLEDIAALGKFTGLVLKIADSPLI